MIKLSLIMCNKFKMNDKLGRYVVSSCLKYTNMNRSRYAKNLVVDTIMASPKQRIR